MSLPDQLAPLLKLGLYRSVDILASFVPRAPARVLIARARALTELHRYNEALKVIDTIDKDVRTEDEMNECIELRFICYLKTRNASKCSALLSALANRTLTPKLHIMAADAYIIQETTHNPANHPAIPHLLEVLKLYPTAIELVEKMLSIGAPIDTILSHVPQTTTKLYLQSLQYTALAQFRDAIACLEPAWKKTDQLPPPPTSPYLLSQICINAWKAGDFSLFDQTAQLLPYDDLEIVDLRAARLKYLRKGDDLSKLVLSALNANEESANAWVAFSHFLDFTGEKLRAMQAARKGLSFDPTNRRALIRYGELRMQSNEIKKALALFHQAHKVQEGIDTYNLIVQCYCLLKDWEPAQSFAMRAEMRYPPETENGHVPLALLGLSLKTLNQAQSVTCLKQALTKQPDYIDALSTLIGFKLQENDFDGAERVLKEYRETNQDFYYWLKLAEIYGLKGDFQNALNFATKATTLDPYDETAKDMCDQLATHLQDDSSEFDGEEDSGLY